MLNQHRTQPRSKSAYLIKNFRTTLNAPKITIKQNISYTKGQRMRGFAIADKSNSTAGAVQVEANLQDLVTL